MAISLLQTTSKNAAAVGSSTLAFPGNVTAGSMLVAYILKNSAGISLTASDNRNGNYSGGSQDISQNVSSTSLAICTFPNAAAGATTVTFSASGGTGSLQCVIEEWAGLATTTPLDKTQANTFIAGTSVSSNATAATSQAIELVLGAVGMDNGQTVTQGAGFTLGTNVNATRTGIENLITSVAGPQTATFTLGASDSGVVLVATYKASGAGGPILMGQACLNWIIMIGLSVFSGVLSGAVQWF
jgi:hypothetical protein